MMARRIGLGLALLILLGSLPVVAQNTYEELNGRFMLDLPRGWKLAPQANEFVYQFKGDGTEQVIIIYLPGADDRADLFKDAVENMQSSAPDAAPSSEVVDLEVNGNPARWGIYSGSVDVQGTTVNLHGLLGSVVLEEGGLYFLSFMNDFNREEWEEPLTSIFQSIREVDAERTGVSSGMAVNSAEVAAPAASAPAHPTEFEDEYISATLPPGWKADPVSEKVRKEDGTVVKFESDDHGNIAVGCFSLLKKMFTPKKNDQALYTEAQNLIRNTISTAETAEGPYEFKNEDGKKITYEVYKGYVIVEGKEIPMHAMHATGKTKRCKEGLSMYGFVGSDVADQAIKEMMAIVRSTR